MKGSCMKIQCDCGKFQALLKHFPKASPGRLVCYCDDCQSYAKKIGREDILDEFGGTEVIPAYPNDFVIQEGKEHLKCFKLSPKGLHRWTAACCNTPIVNTMPKFPWLGIPRNVYTNADSNALAAFGKVRSRIKGKFKTGDAPFKISDDLGFMDALTVIPFIAKGFIFKKFSSSPFLKDDGKTPMSEPHYLN